MVSFTKPKLIVICGPTATGKSDLAVEVAKKISGPARHASRIGVAGGEIISSDSRQVYRGLDIGSGKITKKEMQGVPHHLLDAANPKKIFTVSNFQKLGTEAINKILKKDKVPIICGGSGFYIEALVRNLVFPDVKPDKKLRKKIKDYNSEKLCKMLLRLDPKRAKEIDKNNKVRLIRAIEIAKALGKVPKIKEEEKYNCLYIGLSLPKEELKEKINIRLNKRMKIGMLAEVRSLHKNGLSWKRLESFGLEYRYIAQFLQKKISKEEMIQKLQKEIWHYAKRQMTWFKRDKEIVWMEAGDKPKIISVIQKFLK